LETWKKLGIPPKRGVLSGREPGTGKTIICKALMSEAENITCINANAFGLAEDDYLTELY
jgi:cell division protease FtsH